ncbi:hypothetical protein M0D21_05700 [Aquimarina sp. D1M17]|uniref:hypothetical protein n=1 Tax=Aquimarina acroporae TaxID=2937283 RepID=UPI0020BF3828|nr:hypothetical protein [Aquimarina acroporae]MCK8521049.1 hypothetical protein [Aquimarina acroporae]
MRKQTAYIIIGIGTASTLFAIYGMIRGGKFIDALSGIIIGLALIGTVIIKRSKKGKAK